MSDRDESRDAQIAGALRKAVADAFRKDPESVTLRTVRNEVAAELGLGEGFFKSDPYWKDKSKEIVLQEGDIQNANMEAPPPASREKKKRVPKASATKKATVKKAALKKEDISEAEPDLNADDEEDIAPKPRKRGRPTKAAAAEGKSAIKPRAKAKKGINEENEKEPEAEKVKKPGVTKKTPMPEVKSNDQHDDSALSDLPGDFPDESEPPKKKVKQSIVQSPSSKKTKSSPKPAKTELVDSEDDEQPAQKAEGNGDTAGGESGDESEMSEVLDVTPVKKVRGRKPASGDSKKKSKAVAAKPKKATKTKAAGKNLSAEEETIKALQGWLVKCGIRKQWSRELAKCDTSKDKIQHLKDMLSDAGMSRPYSATKASKIKARRELEDEVAGVQAGAADWNNTNEGMVTTRSGRSTISTPNTGRKLVQKSHGLDGLEFLDDQSDSE